MEYKTNAWMSRFAYVCTINEQYYRLVLLKLRRSVAPCTSCTPLFLMMKKN